MRQARGKFCAQMGKIVDYFVDFHFYAPTHRCRIAHVDMRPSARLPCRIVRGVPFEETLFDADGKIDALWPVAAERDADLRQYDARGSNCLAYSL